MIPNDPKDALTEGAIAGVFVGVLVLIGIEYGGLMRVVALSMAAGFTFGALTLIVAHRCLR